jgi:hypothetical protein
MNDVINNLTIYNQSSQNQINKIINPDKSYMYKDAIIYQDIMSIYNNGTIQKYNDPIGWDSTTYINSIWNGRLMLNIGKGNNTNAGIQTTVPDNYNVLWIRVFNDRECGFNVTFFSCGFMATNQISLMDLVQMVNQLIFGMIIKTAMCFMYGV